MKTYRKRIYITMLMTLMMVQNVFGMSLIDKHGYQNEQYGVSKRLGVNTSRNQKAIKDVITSDDWNGYTFRPNHKYLMNHDILHEFNQNDRYVKSIKKSVSSGTVTLEVKYLRHLETETSRYILSGFDSLPTRHVTTIKNGNSYFNQYDNKIEPKQSCLPTAMSMYLHIKGFTAMTPDDISKHVKYNPKGGGTVISVVIASVETQYTIKNAKQIARNHKANIKEYISNDKPMIAYIKTEYIDYNYNAGLKENEYTQSRQYGIRTKLAKPMDHAILITGFLEIDGELHLEIYDPISLTTSSVDSESIPSGKGRFMTYTDFEKLNVGPLVHFDISHK